MSDAATPAEVERTRTRERTATADTLRYSAPQTAPQRTPRWPDTAWGRLRGAQRWSLRDLSARTGINSGLLSRIERGFGPTPDQARALLRVYDNDGPIG